MAPLVLTLNAGSSSLKASVIEVDRRDPVAETNVSWGADATRVADRHDTVADAVGRLGSDFDAVGHRVVHGGLRFREPTVVDDTVLAELDGLADLAPLHNPVAVDTIRAARELLPDLPHVAVFDTAFHATLDEAAYVYPLPWEWYSDWGIRRFGFHGIAVEWDVRRAAEELQRDAGDLSLVVAHLGSGCSVTAVARGRSVFTSMGMTPLEGLMMGTRAGSFDPGVALRVLREERVTLGELAEALDHGSGLQAVSGIGADMRKILAEAESGNERAALAVEMFCRRAAEGIAAAATSLPRLDAIVFSGGIGQNAAVIRARIVGRLSAIGVPPIEAVHLEQDGILSAPESAVAVLAVEAREDLVIADAVASSLRHAVDS